jgi:hypothetical protein
MARSGRQQLSCDDWSLANNFGQLVDVQFLRAAIKVAPMIADAPGVTVVGYEQGRAIYWLWSGSYRFTVVTHVTGIDPEKLVGVTGFEPATYTSRTSLNIKLIKTNT